MADSSFSPQKKYVWWYTYPSEKYEFVRWDYYSKYMEKQSPCILRKSPDLLSPRHSRTCTPEPIQLPIRFFKTSFSVQQMAMEWMEWGIASSMFPL
jgi:hypothetical protein